MVGVNKVPDLIKLIALLVYSFEIFRGIVISFRRCFPPRLQQGRSTPMHCGKGDQAK